jgi:hypothetical protein
MEKWKFLTLPGLELPLPLVVQLVASRYTDWAIPAPVYWSLPSNKRLIVAHVGSHGNVFTESLPSKGSIPRNILKAKPLEHSGYY